MPCLASVFDAMSGVKKLPNFIPAITCPISAFEASLLLVQQVVDARRQAADRLTSNATPDMTSGGG